MALPDARARLLPPLKPLADESPVKARANWRWMLATALTGVCAFALMGGALYTTFGGREGLIYMPAEAHPAGGGKQGGGYALASADAIATANRAAKTNRMGPADSGFAIKQIFHESTIAKVGDKEFIKVRPYARFSASLASLPPDRDIDLPPFNPLKLFAEAAEDNARPPRHAAYQSSGEIKVTLASFAPHASAYADDGVTVSDAELAVREFVEMNNPSGVHEPAAGNGGGDSIVIDAAGTVPIHEMMAQADRTTAMTEIERSATRPAGSDIADKSITISTGDTLSSILLANGATRQEVREIANAMTPAFPASRLMQGQQMRIGFAQDDSRPRLAPVRVSIFDGDDHAVTVGLVRKEGDANAHYVRLEDADALLADDGTLQVNAPTKRANLYESLYQTGLRANLPRPVIDRMVRVHAYDVDFKRGVQPGDSLEVFYVADDNEGNISGEPEILYSALTIRGETKRFYRFRTPDDGAVDYYDEEGKSAKKFLIRKPINGGVMRSGFGMRRHPILGYRKMHTGVDWAARSGTPIVAAGNGIVEKAEWTSGYGRYTVIRHANGYKSAYAHQSGFAKGVSEGAKVRQGQVIGFVGSTGLSTGPHLHYEVVVNGRFVDPMRIRVPRGRSLQGRLLAAFQREKNRIDRLMSLPPAATRVAAKPVDNPARTALVSRR